MNTPAILYFIEKMQESHIEIDLLCILIIPIIIVAAYGCIDSERELHNLYNKEPDE